MRAVTRILFVCLGNICRSPTAEGVMRHLVREAGLEDRVEIDSAGTGGWHVGAPPDAFNREGQDWGLPPIVPSRRWACVRRSVGVGIEITRTFSHKK